MKEISVIKRDISAFKNAQDFVNLQTRWDADYDLFRLKQYDAGSGYYSYTSNLPRVFADKVLSTLESAKLFIRVPDDVLTEPERTIANNVERFLYGCYNINDERNLDIPDTPSIRAQKAWFAAIRGGFASCVYVHKDTDSTTRPDVRIWDIYDTSYGRGERGVLWGAVTRKSTREQVNAEFDFKSKGDSVELIEYWDTDSFGVIADDAWALKPVKHGLSYCPVFVFKVGGTQAVTHRSYPDAYKHIGESIYSSNRNLYPMLNKLISDMMTIIRRGVKVPYGYWSATGTKNIEEDIWQVSKAASVPFQTGDEFKPLIPPTMPANTIDAVNFISDEEQRGALPHTGYGQLGTRLSGYAITQLQASMQTIMQPTLSCIEQSYRKESIELLKQYSRGNFAPISVRGRTAKNQTFGYPKAVMIAPKDIQGDWHPEVTLEAVLPKDDAQKLQMANMARQGAVPLLSMKTIRADLLGVADTDLEEDNIEFEWGKQLIINRLYRAYQRAIEDQQPDYAKNILSELTRLLQSQGGQSKPPSSPIQGQSPIDAIAMETAGGGMPPTETGMSSSTLPVESLGGMPPGSVNATQ